MITQDWEEVVLDSNWHQEHEFLGFGLQVDSRLRLVIHVPFAHTGAVEDAEFSDRALATGQGYFPERRFWPANLHSGPLLNASRFLGRNPGKQEQPYGILSVAACTRHRKIPLIDKQNMFRLGPFGLMRNCHLARIFSMSQNEPRQRMQIGCNFLSIRWLLQIYRTGPYKSRSPISL